ncbi:endonuclease/exonuclease/phosphatase [Glaciecola punicea]|jgi:endonuclease/exonuclease/phosphatase family metal-dependent hydrolase|uniref:endonuclease/exonuclease/phosphatase family protein n=1 Tax=Glaciecola punicea TaxID=56804 RepID=UPI000871D261|nr:endonuclease/exonuclease/phosphatase family protein [Glaciecola punicea]OFA31094.1 endonuclease/exonuclease/phosphatase [Glaciecola punicea]
MKLQKILLIMLSAVTIAACSSNNAGLETPSSDLYLATAEVSAASSQIYKAGWSAPANYAYTNQNTLKIISWNVEHFVDQHNDPYVNNSREDDAQHMGNKRADLVIALQQANADIVVLQEFESAKLLREIASTDLADMGYQFFADAPSHTWYMNVVIMSKVPLGVMYNYGNLHTELVNWRDEDGEPATQSRLNTRTWAIEVYPSDTYSFVLGAVHLKAGRDERDIATRLGQINMLKAQFERFLNEDNNRNILLVGDFNALPNTLELSTLLAGTNAGNTFVDPLGASDFTHPAIAPVRRLDYAVMNHNMHAEMVPNSAKVITYFDAQRQDDLADHLPVVIEFFLQDAPVKKPAM